MKQVVFGRRLKPRQPNVETSLPWIRQKVASRQGDLDMGSDPDTHGMARGETATSLGSNLQSGRIDVVRRSSRPLGLLRGVFRGSL